LTKSHKISYNIIKYFGKNLIKWGNNMRRVLTLEATTGMVIAGDVYNSNGHLVLVRGTILNNDTIEKLKKYSVFDFFITEEEDIRYLHKNKEDLDDKEIKDAEYYTLLRQTKEFRNFEKNFEKSLVKVKDSINGAIIKSKDIDTDELLGSIKDIMSGFEPDVKLFDMLHCVENYDDLTYVHSINVSIICRVMGIWMRLSKEDLDILTLSGLLHDVGKVMIPNDIITKPGRLTISEFALVQAHPIHGYNVLKDQNIDNRIKLAALEHHERCDGLGYPEKKKYNEISDFSKIAAIADVYDAMTANRVYRSGICPFDVISTFEENMDSYDPRFLSSFLEKIANSYINTEVYINDEFEGKIVLINKYALGKPGVMINGEYVDLSKNNCLKITSFK